MDVVQETDFLAGGGEMGALIQAKDWSGTPLGPVEGWSISLRMMVGFLLANRFPLLLWWGPDYVSIYNDPYRPVLGTKHPWALGQPVRDCWSEIWDVLRPLIDTPFRGGAATWMEDLPLEINRHGFVEETHFTVAYSPVPDDTAPNGIGGVLATVHEITEKVVGERRIAALRDLGARTGEAKTAEEACAIAAAALAKHGKDVPFALVYLLDDAATEARLAATTGVAKGEPAAPEVVGLDRDNGPDRAQIEPWPLAEVLRGEQAVTVDDLARRFNKLPAGPWSDPPHSAVVVPIRSNVAHRLAGFLVAGASPRLRLDEQYRSFFDLAAAQVATAVATARALEQERRRAEVLAEIDRAKTMFFSNVSHEFRTPLTLMLGPLEDALAARDLPVVERLRIEVAHRNSLRLLRLVNSLLDFSRIEAGRAQACYAPADLAALTAEIASNFRSACERVRIALVVDCSPLPEPVHVDRDMWEKIVLNLLSNAFKFTFAGEIVVRLRAAGGHAELTVRDTGVGIPASELPRVFERFHRIEGQKSRSYEGSGIGLALVQELVKLHGGTIRAASEEGRGATFTVAIPFGTAHLPADRIGMAPSLASTAVRAEAYVAEALRWQFEEEADFPDARSEIGEAGPLASLPGGARILLADDNADMRAYVRRLLGSQCEVEAVPDGEAALAAARARRPDLVVADVMMPRLAGFGLLRAIRADAALAEIPVIMLSARAGEESRVEGLDAGADDYLVKPFSARELVARVGAHLQIGRIRRETTAALRTSEERQAFLLQLSDVLQPLADPAAIKEVASRLLGQRLGASRVAYFNVADGDYVIEGDYADGVARQPGRYPIAAFGPKLFAAYNSGLAVWVDDVEADSGLTADERASFAAVEIRAHIGVPLIKAGKFVAGLAVQSSAPRHWTADEVSLVEETARRTWDAVQRALAETARRDSDARLQAIFAGAYEHIGVLALDGTLIDANRAALALGPGRREEVIGKPFWEAIWFRNTPGAPEKLRRSIARAAKGKLVRYEAALVHPSGRIVTFDFSLHPVRNEDGKATLIVFEGRDISERKLADEVKANLAAIVESSDDAIVSKNLDGVIRTWNRGAQRLFGYTAEEAVGQPVTMLMPPERYDEEPAILARIRRGESIDHYETVRRHKDGTLLDISLTVSPIADTTGRITGASKIARDIGARKRIERRALAQGRVLEMVATGRLLGEILERLMLFIESQEAGMTAGLLLTDDGVHFRPGSGPSLPPAFREAMHEAIRTVAATPPYFTACAEAVHRSQVVVCPDLARETRYAGAWRNLMLASGLRAVRSTPVRGSDGRVLGCLALYFRTARDPGPADPELVDMATHLAAIAIERDREREALVRSERNLSLELAATRRLQAMGAELVGEQDVQALYGKIVDAAADIMQSDCASMQTLHPKRGEKGELQLLASRGFPEEAVRFWQWVRADSGCTCGEALRTRARAIAADVATCAFMAGTPDRETYLAAGMRAAQSTPLVSRGGELLGMLSTHWRRPHMPSESDLRQFDVLARQAADLVERAQSEEALKQRATQLRLLLDELNHRVKNTLATVQSLATQTLRNASSAAQGRLALEARLMALARAHDVLTREHWEGASLHEVVANAMSAYAGGGQGGDGARARIESHGPEIWLRPKAALALSMALHELATNAVKHGALSDEGGRVAIDWQVTGEQGHRFRLEWRESDGPPVAAPSRRGFGSRLLEQGLAHDLAGEVRLDYRSAGLVCAIEAPVDEIRAGIGERAEHAAVAN